MSKENPDDHLAADGEAGGRSPGEGAASSTGAADRPAEPTAGHSENSEAAELADTAISVAAHLESELEEALAEHRLTRPSFLVLDALERAEGHTMNQRDLVTRVRRTSGTLSVRLGRLERARMIEREPDPENRRSVTVTLTGRGRALVEVARPAYAERAERLVAGLPAGSGPEVAEQLQAWLGFFEPDERVTPRLGVAVAGAAVAKRMRRAVGLPDEAGVLVVRVGRDSPAARAGLSRGDLITRAGESQVHSIGDLHRAVRSANGKLTLHVLRGADPQQVEVAF
jgi:DNA-binding MarR family transcriptional regulator